MLPTNHLQSIGTILVAVSITPILWRVCRREIEPVLASWIQWSIIGLVLFATNFGWSEDKNWSFLFTFVNPSLVTMLLWHQARKSTRQPPLTASERRDISITSLLLIGWIAAIGQPVFQVVLVLIANTVAARPTITRAYCTPERDHPLGWSLLTLGFAVSIAGTQGTSVLEYIMPTYMLLFGFTISILLWRPQRQKRVRLRF